MRLRVPCIRTLLTLAAVPSAFAQTALAQTPAPPAPLAARADTLPLRHDALHYDIDAELPDTGSLIRMSVATTWRLTSADSIVIELDTVFSVSAVTVAGAPAPFVRRGGLIVIANARRAGDTVTTRVAYAGRPREALTIGVNAYGARTIFADNWPDRAHHWLASQDHPSQKATADFHIETSAGVRAIANGVLVRNDTLAGGRVRWHYRIAEPIPVYTMVIGAGRLATATLPDAACAVRCVPLAVVTYPEDSAFAVTVPFQRAGAILDYFSATVGPFPYERLSHVESTTMFGGMENSTAIFYDDKGYHERRMGELVVAHETAHQWFGDAVTEADWHHVWLSEGFATYFTALWLEHAQGIAARDAQLKANAERIFASKWTEHPVIDVGTPDLLSLLNSNSYQKGGWVLHSLRGVIGDSAFFAGIRAYYARYRNGTALSSDFARTMGEAAGRDLDWYFRQALTQPGYPVLAMTWRRRGNALDLTITQTQPRAWGLYRLPGLVIDVDGRRVRVDVDGATTHATVAGVTAPPKSIVVDPDGWWLMRWSVAAGS